MINLNDFDSYKAYFETIATEHTDLDGFLFGDSEVQVNEGKSWNGRMLLLEPWLPATIEDQKSDNYLQRKQGSLFIGGVAVSEAFTDEYNYFRDCEVVAKDIISRMLKEVNEGTIITSITTWKIGMGELILGATKITGCRLDFFFLDPSGFPYNAAKWN